MRDFSRRRKKQISLVFVAAAAGLALGLIGASEPELTSSNAGEASSPEACFSPEAYLPPYLEALRQSGLPGAEMGRVLLASCGELDDPDKNEIAASVRERTILDRLSAFASFVPLAALQDVPTVIGADMLGGSSQLRAYRSRLDAIGRIENRYERIRRVYELAVKSQGQYDYEGPLSNLFSTPSRVLDRARERGKGGVCRDFSLLLHWSLMQVAKSPTLSPRLAQWGMLDGNSFNARRVSKTDHIWVEVLLPFPERGGIRWERLHLDSTWYEPYAPLFPRQRGLSESQRVSLHQQCARVKHCLDTQGVRR